MSFEDYPDYDNPVPVGKVVNLTEHCYDNKFGGTELGGAIRAKITKAWWDYECGWRYWGCPTARKSLKRIYFSQFDVKF
jgi:hypothetical protein